MYICVCVCVLKRGPRPSPCSFSSHILPSVVEGPLPVPPDSLCVLQLDKGAHCPGPLSLTAALLLYIITCVMDRERKRGEEEGTIRGQNRSEMERICEGREMMKRSGR